MKYWNGTCWKDHHESTLVEPISVTLGVDESMLTATREEVEHAKANPLNLVQKKLDDYERAKLDDGPPVVAEIEATAHADGTVTIARTGERYDRQTLGRYVPRCDFGDCVEEKEHDGNHRDRDGRRLYASIAPQTDQQKRERTLGPIRCDASPDDRRGNPPRDYSERDVVGDEED